MPFILTIFKLCKRFKIEHDMIKSLSYNDLLYLVIDFQKDEVEAYLQNQKGNKNESEKKYLNEEEVMKFHS